VCVIGRETGETESLARRLAADAGMSYISPYNDLDVIAGQGTVGEEIIQQLGGQAVDAVVVAVGGGGLVSGIGAAIKSVLPGVRIIGASPVNDAAMAASVRAGKVVQVDALPTISDGRQAESKQDPSHCRCAPNSSTSGFSSPSRRSTPHSGS
jgi:threonine dehydratase